MPGELELQVTLLVTSRDVVSENVPVAVYCWLVPSRTVGLPALISMDVSVADEFAPDDPQPNASESTTAAADNEIKRDLRHDQLLLYAMAAAPYLVRNLLDNSSARR